MRQPSDYAVYYQDGIHRFTHITRLYRECYKMGKPLSIVKFFRGTAIKGKLVKPKSKNARGPWIVKFK